MFVGSRRVGCAARRDDDDDRCVLLLYYYYIFIWRINYGESKAGPTPYAYKIIYTHTLILLCMYRHVYSRLRVCPGAEDIFYNMRVRIIIYKFSLALQYLYYVGTSSSSSSLVVTLTVARVVSRAGLRLLSRKDFINRV